MTKDERAMMDDMKHTLIRLDERGARMELDLGKITHVLLEGNGSPPITTSVATQGVQLIAINARLAAIEHAPETSSRLKGSDKYMMYAALISGLFTLIELIVRRIHG